MEFTQEEYVALIRYQDNDYNIFNSLLRLGYESERIIDKRSKDGYPYLTKETMDDCLSCIGSIFSSILKVYQSNGCVMPNKITYRGSQIRIVEAMNGDVCSFLSTTTCARQTNNFSSFYNKDNTYNTSEKAFVIVEGNVPWINIDDLMGGMEEEIIFVPAKVLVSESNISVNPSFGKVYQMTLSELDIPEKTEEEILRMRQDILDKTELMSEYLKLILDSSFKDKTKIDIMTQEYNKWKSLVVSYNHQQYRVLRNNIIKPNDVKIKNINRND